jgi:hypothetical protein
VRLQSDEYTDGDVVSEVKRQYRGTVNQVHAGAISYDTVSGMVGGGEHYIQQIGAHRGLT